ncbi:hypothetical protein CC78DRAFT_583015 [Lojkania enalia]|uniref:Uncharacterized protein n=1 Tax=Lojkania enalia TaxID=147567 RepID=A0A9P4N183_9PLEO|nr:hypothetical protein CC78DRAFT_583015 [Didymosphaeria enalia]
MPYRACGMFRNGNGERDYHGDWDFENDYYRGAHREWQNEDGLNYVEYQGRFNSGLDSLGGSIHNLGGVVGYEESSDDVDIRAYRRHIWSYSGDDSRSEAPLDWRVSKGGSNGYRLRAQNISSKEDGENMYCYDELGNTMDVDGFCATSPRDDFAQWFHEW